MRLPLLTAAIALLHSGAAAQGQGVPEISLGPIEAKLLYKATGRLSDNLLGAKLAGQAIDEARFRRYFVTWFVLGWPAFAGLVAVFWLMVAKPA